MLERLATWVCSDDRKQRLRIQRSLLAAVVFIACCVLQVYACWMGYMDAHDVKLLSGAIVVNVVFWYAVLRSGFNLRFADPALTLPQILAAQTIIMGAYAVTGPVHGSTLMLLALVMVFGVFNMRHRDARIASLYTVALMGVVSAIKTQTDPLLYPFKLEVAHFVITAAIVPTISSLAAQLASLRARLQSQKEELQSALVRIQELATIDELTGLVNRRHMMERLHQQQATLGTERPQRFCLALLDLDHFKRINDTHGHGVGDEVLRHFAQHMRQALRPTDVLSRWGGEELLLMLDEPNPEAARRWLERARQVLAGITLAPSVPELKPTFSAGLTDVATHERLAACIERADRALYVAKDQGRNQTVLRPRALEPHPQPADPAQPITRLAPAANAHPSHHAEA